MSCYKYQPITLLHLLNSSNNITQKNFNSAPIHFRLPGDVTRSNRVKMAANFCFNFEIPESDSEFLTNEPSTKQKEVIASEKTDAEFLNISQEDLDIIFEGSFQTKHVQILELEYGMNTTTRQLVHLLESYVENLMENLEEYSSSATKQALESKTDLIPSCYEGGLKIWECSLDLVNYLNKLTFEKKMDFTDKKVLELGCGAGLPGIYACLEGARVYFQDYNSEVLKLFTIPNVVLNLNSANSSIDVSKNQLVLGNIQGCKFLCGDWDAAKSLLEPASFDVILTSETIYNVDAQKSLYELMKSSMKPSGVAFVAAKSYYFGVGGGTDQFAEMVKKDSAFDVSRVITSSQGVKREVLVMQRNEIC